MMKSCLKPSPPLTPLLSSATGSPSSSGRASPTYGNIGLPPLRKTVSFCQEEEFFQADDWDRTPAPVAPKLSYQDILELKQIMQSLPRAPYSPGYRQPFTTSVPQLSAPTPPSSKAFPVSRFAAAPSLTPSRWKNRDDTGTVDPTILPYLDSVPIQLLPLLPPSCEEPQSGKPAHPSSTTANTGIAAVTKPQPIKPPIPASTISIPSVSSSTPIVSSASPPTPRRTNFAFVPLLPVKEELKAPAPPVIVTPPTPTRKFNMTFVPLLPPEEPHLPTPTAAPVAVTEPAELTPQRETPPSEEQLEEVEEIAGEPELIHSPPPRYMPLTLRDVSRSYSSTPSLSSASDTDTESETPSVSSPCPSSPMDEGLSHYFATRATLPSHSESFDAELFQQSLDIRSNHNPYFPPVTHDTPPLSRSQVDLTAAVRKMQLEALPSPALQPPSPFSLYAEEENSAFSKVPSSRRSFIARPSSLSEATLTPGMSPDITIESMRANTYGKDTSDSILAPSIRRREY